MSLAKESIRKLMDEMKKNKGQSLNIGIQVGKRNPRIDHYCHNCQGLISRHQHKKGKGLCKSCVAIN